MTPPLGESLAPLDIKCTSSDCENGLHCFCETKKMRDAGETGKCRKCGIELVDWSRVFKKDRADAAYTIAALQRELIRHHFWHVDIDERAVNHARRKGLVQLRIATEQRLRKSIGSAQPPWDGRQTPRESSGNAIYYAQHAVACCCRRCLECWHDIPRGRALTDEEIGYLTDLVMLYIQQRLPLLTTEGEHVPHLRHPR